MAGATEITLGNGEIAYFFAYLENKTVKHALCGERWFKDLAFSIRSDMFPKLSRLAVLTDEITLNAEAQDTIRWCFSESGTYTAKSAYLRRFEGATRSTISPIIWMARRWASAGSSFGWLRLATY